jgi:hypothetical protein
MLVAMRDPSLLPLIRLFGRYSALLVGMAITLALGLVGSLALVAGVLLEAPGGRIAQSAVQLWINALATGYVVATALYASRRLDADLAVLRPDLAGGTWERDPQLFARNHHPRGLALATAAGALFGAGFNIERRGLLWEWMSGQSLSWEYAWGPAVLILLWAAVFHVLWVLLDHTRLLARLAREGVRVELHRPGVFDPIANAGIRHLLLILVGLAVIPAQSILTGTLAPADFTLALVVVAPAALVVLITPVYGAHRALRSARSAELERVDAELRGLERHTDRYLLLALYRYRVAELTDWPLSLRLLGRVAVYLVIPPLAWVAAAFVESRVSDLM